MKKGCVIYSLSQQQLGVRQRDEELISSVPSQHHPIQHTSTLTPVSATARSDKGNVEGKASEKETKGSKRTALSSSCPRVCPVIVAFDLGNGKIHLPLTRGRAEALIMMMMMMMHR